MLNLDKHICICGYCIAKSTNSIISAKPKGKKTEFILNNNSSKKVDKFIVDDCLLKACRRHEKCDYLFRIKEDKIAYLIECKGSDVLKAVTQINSTLTILKDDLKNFILKGKIITTKIYSPDLRNKEYKNLRAKLNSHLETRNIKIVETI